MGQYKGILGGIDQMMASRFVPWHYSHNKDRVNLTDMVIRSGRQAMTMAKMDWEVEVINLATLLPDMEGAEDFSIARRMDTNALLGVGSDTYTAIQNMASADVADAIITAYPEASIEACGSLYVPGRVTWMLVRLPDRAVKFGTDGAEHHERYVLISNSHDGSKSFTIRFTDVRVECMNTITLAWNKTQAEYTIRHTTNAAEYVEQARQAMLMASANFDAQDAAIKKLLDTKVETADFVIDMLPKVIGKPRPEEEGRGQTAYDEKFMGIVSAYNADHNEAIVDTAWGAVNAVNEYEEWGIKPRGQETWERQMGMLLRGDYPMTKSALALLS